LFAVVEAIWEPYKQIKYTDIQDYQEKLRMFVNLFKLLWINQKLLQTCVSPCNEVKILRGETERPEKILLSCAFISYTLFICYNELQITD